MPTIKISDLHSTGAELFSDSESYMNELSNAEIELVNGASLIGAIVKLGKKAGKKIYSASVRYSPQIADYDPSKISVLC